MLTKEMVQFLTVTGVMALVWACVALVMRVCRGNTEQGRAEVERQRLAERRKHLEEVDRKNRERVSERNRILGTSDVIAVEASMRTTTSIEMLNAVINSDAFSDSEKTSARKRMTEIYTDINQLDPPTLRERQVMQAVISKGMGGPVSFSELSHDDIPVVHQLAEKGILRVHMASSDITCHSSWHQVSPIEVTHALLNHPRISDAVDF